MVLLLILHSLNILKDYFSNIKANHSLFYANLVPSFMLLFGFTLKYNSALSMSSLNHLHVRLLTSGTCGLGIMSCMQPLSAHLMRNYVNAHSKAACHAARGNCTSHNEVNIKLYLFLEEVGRNLSSTSFLSLSPEIIH